MVVISRLFPVWVVLSLAIPCRIGGWQGLISGGFVRFFLTHDPTAPLAGTPEQARVGRLHMSKYAPLVSYLRTVPPEQPSARLTYTEIEFVLGRLLPRGAWLPHFWSGSRTARQHWEAVGFHATLDRPARTVVFTRQPS